MMKVSAIIAAYNAEKYLTDTLESIVNQTIDSYEIIVVNDGSTDGTLDILQSYQESYPHLRVITKENGGPSAARNLALEQATGEFVYFLDADDIVEVNALELMYEAAKTQKADLVIAKYDIFNQFKTIQIRDLDAILALERIDKYDPHILWTFSLWNKLFKRDIIEKYNLRFPPISYSEDGVFTMSFVFLSNRITGLNEVVLHYRRMLDGEDSSITATISDHKVADYIEAHHRIYQETEHSMLIDYPQYETIEELKRENEELHGYIQTIHRKELQILLDHFYAKFWSLEENTVRMIVDELNRELRQINMKDYSLLMDSHPEYSLSHLYVKQSEVFEHAFTSYVLYGTKEEEAAFLKVLQSVLVQNLISVQIYLPAHMKLAVEQAGMMQGNVVFVEAGSEDELFYHVLDRVSTTYIIFGNPKVAYAGNAFKYAFKRFIKSPADFMIELVYHKNYGDIQAVLLDNIALNSQKGGYEYNEFMSMDYLLANKFFKTEFLKRMHLNQSRPLLSHLPMLSKRGYYVFMNDAVVFYEDAENTYKDFVATGESISFIEDYLTDKDVNLNSEELNPAPEEIMTKMMRFPSYNIFQILYRKTVSFIRRSKLKNQVLFFTIRKNGELEGNAKALYPYVKGKKIIRAKMLPHNMFQELRMYRAISTSKVIVTDDYVRYLRYFPLKKEQRVVQLWHACGAFKKFGRRGTNLSVYTDTATHAQYNMVTVSGDYIRSIYADAFDIDPNRVKAMGVPRTDDFFNPELIEQTKQRIYEKYPEFRNKTIIIYAPTFRDINNNRQEFHPELDFDRLSEDLLPNQMFLVCPHPVMQNAIVEKKYSNIRVIRDFSTNDLMFISDMLITDYSSVIFEYALLKKPIAFYCYDLSTYDRGFYLNYPEDLPGDVYVNQNELTGFLRDESKQVLTGKYNLFVERYMSACDGHSSERIAKLINSYMEESENEQ